LSAQVPVLTVDGEQLNDSSFIIKALSAKLEQTRNKVKLSGKAAAEEEEWFRQACDALGTAWALRRRSSARVARRRRALNQIVDVHARLTRIASTARPLQVGGWALRARPHAKHLPHAVGGDADV
jgi:hypothetical protein